MSYDLTPINNSLKLDPKKFNSVRPDFSEALKPIIEQAQMISHQLNLQRQRDSQREQEKLEAAQQTASNTKDISNSTEALLKRADSIIDNQNELIKYQRQQLEVLKNLFASGEDGVAVQKEIMKYIEEIATPDQKEFLKDKLGDVGFGLILAGI